MCWEREDRKLMPLSIVTQGRDKIERCGLGRDDMAKEPIPLRRSVTLRN